MEYIDIDSSYRVRRQFPLQAEFDVIRQQNTSCCLSLTNYLDPVSKQAVLYPPTVNTIVAFTEEDARTYTGQMVETNQLPRMYKTDNETVIRLDAMAIQSMDSDTRDIIPNALYPNGYIPLGSATEYYTGSFLEHYELKEYRLITGFQYDTDSTILQTGHVMDSITVGSVCKIFTTVYAITDIPTSNIDRYYVGKYLKMVDGNAAGSLKLIADYIPGENQNTFILDSPFGNTASFGDTFQIITTQSWYAIIQSPFTTELPTYPCFRQLLPAGDLFFQSNVILSSSNVISFLSIKNRDVNIQGLGIVYVEENGELATNGDYPLGDLYFTSSTDNSVSSFREPYLVFPNVYADTTDLFYGTTSFITLPYITHFVQQEYLYNTASSNVTNYLLLQANDSYGITGWDVGATPLKNFTEALNPAVPWYRGTSLHTILNTASSDRPMSVYVIYDATTAPFLYLERGGGNALVTIDSGAIGDNMEAFGITNVGGFPVVYYRKNQSLIVVRSTTTTGTSLGTDTKYTILFTNLPMKTYWYYTRHFNLGVDLVVSNSVLRYAILYYNGTSNTLDSLVAVVFDDISTSSASDSKTLLVGSINTFMPINFLYGCKLAQATVNSETITMCFVWGTIGLFVMHSTNFHSTSPFLSIWNLPTVIDNADILDADIVTNNDGVVTIIYSRRDGSGSKLVSLLLEDSTPLHTCAHYRIRSGAPMASETSPGTLSGTTTTITLPPTAATMYEGQYIHLFSLPIYNIPDPFYNYDEYIWIKQYDPSTNTITLSTPLSYDPNIYAYATVGITTIYLEMGTDLSTLGEDSSGNGYTMTVGANAQYVSVLTDVNDVTVHNILYANGTANSGLTRTITNDTVLQSILLNNSFVSTPLTISMWVYFNSLSGSRTIFNIQRNSPLLKFIIETFSTQLRVFGMVYSVPLVINTWYHIVFVSDRYNHRYIYINNEDVTDLFTPINSFTLFSTPFNSLSVGNDGNQLNGYMKDAIITGAVWTPIEVTNAYYRVVQPAFYAIGWEILGDVQDNFHGLNYTGSRTLDNLVCYEMELTHLTLPNVILKTGFGNRIAYYPYVYVVFENLNDIHGYFYSNNPAANKAIFKVPIRDTSTPDRAYFVNNTSGMRIKTKFNPNDNFKFAIYLMNGDLMETLEVDTQPPQPPNPLLQISLTVGFRRI